MEITVKGKAYVIDKDKVEKINKKCQEHEKNSAFSKDYRERTCKQCLLPFFKYYSSKSKLCCSCKALNRSIKHGATVEIKPGFPRIDKIQTMEELEEYYNRPRMECLLCGNEYKALNHHLRKAHEMTVDEYKIKFGLYLSRGLYCPSTHDKASINGRIMFKENEVVANALNCLEKTRNTKTRMGHVHSPALLAQQIEIAKTKTISDKHISKRLGLVEAICSVCHKPAGLRKEMGVITQTCKILCGTCKRLSHRRSQDRWFEKQGINRKDYIRVLSRRSHLRKEHATTPLRGDRYDELKRLEKITSKNFLSKITK